MFYLYKTLLLTAVVSNSYGLLPPNYMDLSAEEKQNMLWSQISSNPYSMNKLPTLYPQYDWVNLSSFDSATYLKKVFERYTDEMPIGRTKLVGPYGVSAKFRYVPFKNTSTGYTGIYNSTTLGIVRCSVGTIGKFAPIQAFKFLIDGQPSKTLLSFRGSGDRPNHSYFGEAPFLDEFGSSGVRNTTTTKDLAFMGSIKLLEGGPNDRPERENSMPPYELGEMTPDGVLVGDRVVSPYHIQMHVTDELRNAIDSKTKVDFRADIIRIVPAGTLLFTLWGQSGPKTPFEPIGQIYTTSNFVASKYQDETLFFRHPSRRWVPPYYHSRNHGYNFQVNMGINI